MSLWDAAQYKYGAGYPYDQEKSEENVKRYLLSVKKIISYLTENQMEELDSILLNLLNNANDFEIYYGGAHKNQEEYGMISYQEIRIWIRMIRVKLLFMLKGKR